jgi:hypothetical protein
MMLVQRISTATSSIEGDVRGILRQSLGEAHGGFAATHLLSDAAGALIAQMDAGKEDFSYRDINLLLSCLAFSLRELGEEEFQTITGYDFSFGESTLAELKKLAKEQS